jgi:hypothetical protein
MNRRVPSSSKTILPVQPVRCCYPFARRHGAHG